MNMTTYQSKTIKNSQTSTVPQVKGPEMNDRDWINDILALEKYLTDNYNVFTREASHLELYQDLRFILDETHDCTRNIFNAMFAEGFYKLQQANPREIQQTREQFTKYLSSQSPY
ncbi:spore coat protein [Halothermothrix orenii]|uniref:Coat F domain protein n=1 Tax=Halothermothrix orenii (strain H 168 / OCM 544 / DSM 9562) TaxID=373903 RepID=B8D118_HALOH|nr:spore coat protein [Halothermothrix orenii]ACL68987.1 hypothetical protein Hore_02260 [Halothermothrix orenii H 168]